MSTPFGRTLRTAIAVARSPVLEVDLMLRETQGNDVFYKDLTMAFYRHATERHRKFPLVGAMTFGAAICRLPDTLLGYLSQVVEAAGRRNMQKAERLGYEFRRFDYNANLAEVAAVRTSAQVRQGEMPSDFLEEELRPCQNPPSRTRTHDYPYYGVFRADRMAAFAGVFVCGQVMLIEQMYGHAEHQADGVVPLLLVRMAQAAIEEWPAVEFYMYGTYFGAGPTMQRFKRKFGFMPVRVRWLLGD